MSRYVLTQEQLDRLQDQIQKLSRLNEVKEQRIKELEVHKVRVSSAEVADLIKVIGKLEDEISELKKINKKLTAEMDADKANATRIKELEVLLQEERKLREYSEAFAEQIELKCAEETLIKNLTTELCQLQREEIEIDNRRILDLQKKLRKFTNQVNHYEVDEDKENRKIEHKEPYGRDYAANPLRESGTNYTASKQRLSKMPRPQSKENIVREKQLKAVIRNLQSQLTEMHDELERIPVKTKEEQKRLKELEDWLGEIGYVAEDVDNMEDIRKDLNYLKSEIDSKRKSIISKEKENRYYSN